MKKIKEEILSSSKSTPSSGDLTPSTLVSTPLTTPSSTPSTPVGTPTTPSFTISSALLGTGAVVMIIFTGYFYINRKKPAQVKPAEQVQPKKTLHFSTCNK